MERLTKQWGSEPAVPARLDLEATLDMPQNEYENLMAMVQNLNLFETACATSDTECLSPEELTAKLARLEKLEERCAELERLRKHYYRAYKDSHKKLSELERQIADGTYEKVVRCKRCKTGVRKKSRSRTKGE